MPRNCAAIKARAGSVGHHHAAAARPPKTANVAVLNHVLENPPGEFISIELLGIAAVGEISDFARQLKRWSEQWSQFRRGDDDNPALDRIVRWLAERLPESETTALCHGDFRIANVMFHATEPRVVGVLDWELSTLGHPLADFSYHCMSWHVTAGQFRGIKGLDHKALGIPSEQEYIAKYCERTGKTIRQEDFSFYLAYNMFRMAGILQGIMKRYVDGTASSAQAKKSGEAARPMAELGWSYVNK